MRIRKIEAKHNMVTNPRNFFETRLPSSMNDWPWYPSSMKEKTMEIAEQWRIKEIVQKDLVTDGPISKAVIIDLFEIEAVTHQVFSLVDFHVWPYGYRKVFCEM